jgi:hypothetical protein
VRIHFERSLFASIRELSPCMLHVFLSYPEAMSSTGLGCDLTAAVFM